MQYNPNGNIRRAVYSGTYKSGFGLAPPNLFFKYIYDNSNRLLKTQNDDGSNTSTFNIINGYDKDGNFVGMKRYGSSNNLADNFTYTYFSGTNKLQKVTGQPADDYSYDNNGNVTYDNINKNSSFKYDHRNLMIENKNVLSLNTYMTRYRYDESGNRISKKQYLYIIGIPPGGTGIEGGPEYGDSIIVDLGDGSGYWSLAENTYYVRDISGKEIAIYSGSSLTQWNIWGLDNVGKINADTTRNYYLKDHLGSVRVVLNSTNTVISAQDYDAWGYLLENRSYESQNARYKFTGKERDKDLESNYDYFGARYYDSRIGRWGGVEPLLDKYPGATPYCYSLDNPILFKDFNGLDLTLGGDKGMALNDLKSMFVDEGIQNRITADDNGVISFDVNGLDMSNDAAIELVYNLVSSENNYLYEVADKTYGIRRLTTDIDRKKGYPVELDFTNTEGDGYENMSITPHIIQSDGSPTGLLPKLGFHGQLSLGKGRWYNYENTGIMPRSNLVFHELAENYYRTEFGQLYSNAHANANAMAANYKKQDGLPGFRGKYEYP